MKKNCNAIMTLHLKLFRVLPPIHLLLITNLHRPIFSLLRAGPMQGLSDYMEERERESTVFGALEQNKKVGQARLGGLANSATLMLLFNFICFILSTLLLLECITLILTL